jgi:hypothetical protein
VQLRDKYKLFIKLKDGTYSKIADEIFIAEISYGEFIFYNTHPFCLDRGEFERINTTLVGVPYHNDHMLYNCLLFSKDDKVYNFIPAKIKVNKRTEYHDGSFTVVGKIILDGGL